VFARAVAAFVAALVGGAASPIIMFPVAIVLQPVRALLVAFGVRFDDENDRDPSSRRLLAAALGLAVALGVGATVIACGHVWARSIGTLTVAGVGGGCAGGIATARYARHGFPGLDAYPFMAIGTAVGAVAAALLAALT
jgi:hypothetical protein